MNFLSSEKFILANRFIKKYKILIYLFIVIVLAIPIYTYFSSERGLKVSSVVLQNAYIDNELMSINDIDIYINSSSFLKKLSPEIQKDKIPIKAKFLKSNNFVKLSHTYDANIENRNEIFKQLVYEFIDFSKELIRQKTENDKKRIARIDNDIKAIDEDLKIFKDVLSEKNIGNFSDDKNYNFFLDLSSNIHRFNQSKINYYKLKDSIIDKISSVKPFSIIDTFTNELIEISPVKFIRTVFFEIILVLMFFIMIVMFIEAWFK